MIRIAVIGLGWWGKQIVGCLAGSPRFSVTAAYDANPRPVTDFAAEWNLPLAENYQAVLERSDVDAVAIVTPHAQHEQQVLAAVEAGKQVFCEKPLALRAASAERMLDACAKANLVLGIGHERRYEPALEQMTDSSSAGILGRLQHIDANVSHDIFRALDPANWRLSKENAPAGAMTALGIHLTDMFVALAGKPVRVIARTARRVFGPPRRRLRRARCGFRQRGVGARDLLVGDAVLWALHSLWRQGLGRGAGRGQRRQGPAVDAVQADSSGTRSLCSFEPTNTVRMNFEAWAEAVEGRAAYRFTPAQLLANVQVLEAVIRSSENGGAPVAIA